MNFAEALLLGSLQGVAEWLPVSSEGLVTAVYSLVWGGDLSEAVGFSLWLHLGTAISALAAFRSEVALLAMDVVRSPRSPGPLTKFFVAATIVSAPIGILLLVGLEGFSERAGGLAMSVVGVFMLVTAAILYIGRSIERRGRLGVTWLDAGLTGVAQGFAALPGLSRSGLTLSVLLGRGIDRGDALTLSFLLSIPVSIGAGVYAGVRTGAHASPEAGVALVAASAVGYVSIRALLKLAQRFNFGWFVALAGIVIIVGGLWQAFA